MKISARANPCSSEDKPGHAKIRANKEYPDGCRTDPEAIRKAPERAMLRGRRDNSRNAKFTTASCPSALEMPCNGVAASGCKKSEAGGENPDQLLPNSNMLESGFVILFGVKNKPSRTRSDAGGGVPKRHAGHENSGKSIQDKLRRDMTLPGLLESSTKEKASAQTLPNDNAMESAHSTLCRGDKGPR